MGNDDPKPDELDGEQLADKLHGEAAKLPREGETIGVGPDEPTQMMPKIPREKVEELRAEMGGEKSDDDKEEKPS